MNCEKLRRIIFRIVSGKRSSVLQLSPNFVQFGFNTNALSRVNWTPFRSVLSELRVLQNWKLFFSGKECLKVGSVFLNFRIQLKLPLCNITFIRLHNMWSSCLIVTESLWFVWHYVRCVACQTDSFDSCDTASCDTVYSRLWLYSRLRRVDNIDSITPRIIWVEGENKNREFNLFHS